MATKVKIATLDPNDPEIKKEHDALEVDLDVQEFDEDYSGLEFPEDVNDKVIKYMEKIIRKSYEYKQYIQYLKDELDITKCAITPSLDIKDFNIGLEFHHYPITLYDIVDTLLRENLYTKREDEKCNLFDVMEEVMKEHYDGNVGLVPLTKTHHEMAHNDSLKIPVTAINGNFRRFAEKHRAYIKPELLDKIQSAELISEEDARVANHKLEKTVLHYNISYNKNNDEEDV